MATRLNAPSTPKFKITGYTGLGGVDYANDETAISRCRTSNGKNFISNNGCDPIKRKGWTPLNINGVSGSVLDFEWFDFGDSYKPIDTTQNEMENLGEYLYIATTDGLYACSKSVNTYTTYKLINASYVRATHFIFNGNIYFSLHTDSTSGDVDHYLLSLAGRTIFRIVGEIMSGDVTLNATYIALEPTIPTIAISRNPDGSDGTSLEAVNRLTAYRTVSFLGNETSTYYYLYPSAIRGGTMTSKMYATVKVERINSNGTWTTLTKGTDYTLVNTTTLKGRATNGDTIHTISVADCVIKFSVAQPPLVAGEDNIKVTFAQLSTAKYKVVDGEQVYYGWYVPSQRCPVTYAKDFTVYGYSAFDRIFCCTEYSKGRNNVYYSAPNDPLYFPDNSYITVGGKGEKITGITSANSYLAVLTDESVFLVDGDELDGMSYYKVIQTLATRGAITHRCFGTLANDPLFLSNDGIYSISTNYGTTEKLLRNRSYFIDKKLVTESNLQNAVAVVWNNYYILCINSHCYILDGRRVNKSPNGESDYAYECYYWDNFPAVCFGIYDGLLYFGTSNGQICKYRSDESNGYSDNGTAIECVWATKFDDDNCPQYYKTLNKKGNLVTLLADLNTSATISYETESGQVFSDNYSLSQGEEAKDIHIDKKINKYKRLRITISNNTLNQPLCILNIIKTYYIGNFSKNRGV